MAAKSSRELLSPLYPDLVENGRLSLMLRRLLPADITIAEEMWFGKVSMGWAFVRKGSRSSDVSTTALKRSFCVNFRNRGFEYGVGFAESVPDVARRNRDIHGCRRLYGKNEIGV
jgi:hypothetical protein